MTIPKMISPGSIDDIRPISVTTLRNKMLESYVPMCLHLLCKKQEKTENQHNTMVAKDLAQPTYW